MNVIISKATKAAKAHPIMRPVEIVGPLLLDEAADVDVEEGDEEVPVVREAGA